MNARLLTLRPTVAETGCWVASNQLEVAQKSSLIHYKNVVDYKVLDYFSA